MYFYNREINFYAPTGSMWHIDINPATGFVRDRYNVWIVLIDGGTRYMRHVLISGRAREDGTGFFKLLDEMKRCWEKGPEYMTHVEDGGFLPISEGHDVST